MYPKGRIDPQSTRHIQNQLGDIIANLETWQNANHTYLQGLVGHSAINSAKSDLLRILDKLETGD